MNAIAANAIEVAEFGEGARARFVDRNPGSDESLDLRLEVMADFVIHLASDVVAADPEAKCAAAHLAQAVDGDVARTALETASAYCSQADTSERSCWRPRRVSS